MGDALQFQLDTDTFIHFEIRNTLAKNNRYQAASNHTQLSTFKINYSSNQLPKICRKVGDSFLIHSYYFFSSYSIV